LAAMPLQGIRIAVTREAARGSALGRQLRRRGAVVLPCPAIATVKIARPPGLARVLARLKRYDWVVFTSANGGEAFFSILKRCSVGSRAFRRARLAAIGPGTADAVRRLAGRRVDVVPRVHIAESLTEVLGRVRGKMVLIPRAAKARDVLPARLRKRGATVDVLKVYRTKPDRAGTARLRRAVVAGSVDAVTFTSSSTVDFSMRAIGRRGRDAFRKGRIAAASIGPVTSRSLRAWGVTPAVEARPYSLKGLVTALVRYYRPRPFGSLERGLGGRLGDRHRWRRFGLLKRGPRGHCRVRQ